METIATLDALRQHIGFSPTDTSDDSRLQAALWAATRRIERATHRHFTPRRATLPHDIDPHEPTVLDLRDDLLELIAISDIGPLDTDDTLLLPGDSLKLQSGVPFQYDTSPLQAVQVTGIWGWHDDWENAWLSVIDTLQLALSDSSNILFVDDVDGGTPYDGGPRFQVGQFIRIEEEYMRVLKTNATGDYVTVKRGINGTTVVSHDAGAYVGLFQPVPDVVALCLQIATSLYREPDMGQSLPPSVQAPLAALRRVRVKA